MGHSVADLTFKTGPGTSLNMLPSTREATGILCMNLVVYFSGIYKHSKSIV